jgi:signal transduction histidine kinase
MAWWRAKVRRFWTTPRRSRVSALPARIAAAADVREASDAVTRAIIDRAEATWAKVISADDHTAGARKLLASIPAGLEAVVDILALAENDPLRGAALAVDARLLATLRGMDRRLVAVLLVGPRRDNAPYNQEAFDFVDTAAGMLSLRYLNTDLARGTEEPHAIFTTVLDTLKTIAAVLVVRGDGIIVHANHLASALLSPPAGALIDGPVSSLPAGLAAALDPSCLEAPTRSRQITASVLGSVVCFQLVTIALPVDNQRSGRVFLAILLPTGAPTPVDDARHAIDPLRALEEIDGMIARLQGVIEMLRAGMCPVAADVSDLTRALDRVMTTVHIGAADPPELLGMVDVDAILRATLAGWRKRLSARLVDVNLDSEPVGPRVLGDAGAVAEVFDRLLENAVAAMPTGGSLVIRVRILKVGDKERMSIEVQDKGWGVAPHLAERVFEPFVSSTGRLGMGLTVCRRIVAAHGGRIWMVSGQGIGTTVRIELPICCTTAKAMNPNTFVTD